MPKIRIQRSDGVIQRQTVSKENLSKYGRVVTNNRGRVAYVKKSSEIRALEIVRGEGATLRRVRLVFKGKYPDTGQRKGGDSGEIYKRHDHKLKLEADLTVTVPAEDLEDFKEQLLEWVSDQAERFGLDADDWRVDEERNEPASGAVVGVEVADVIFRNRSNDAATNALKAQADAILADYEGREGEGDEEEAEILERAEQRTDKRGRTYWFDPVTGRRTLNPELIR
jgi:hypothetical protein